MKLNKKILFLTIFFQLVIAISCNAFEKSDNKVYIFYVKRYAALKNSKVLIIDKKTELYKDIENFKVIKTLRYKEEVTILETPTDHCFKEGKNFYQFYKIKTEDNVTGWIKTSSFLFPYLIKGKEVYGVGQEIIYAKERNSYISDARLIFYDGRKKLKRSLYTSESRFWYDTDGKKNNYYFVKDFDPIGIKIAEINNDNNAEIILKGRYSEGVLYTDRVYKYDAEVLYNIQKNNIIEILLKKIYGYFYAKIREYKYDYKYLNLDKDGFIETIDCVYTLKDNQAVEFEDEKEITTELYEYKWDGEKYNYTIYLTPEIDNLRFRKSSGLNAEFIRMLNKGERLELLEKGERETIDNTTGNWTKVKTDQGEIGWCFDYYLEAWKRNK